MPEAASFDHLVGHRFPGGTYPLSEWEGWLWADAAGAAPDRVFAHPGMAYMVGLHGGGASIAEIMELFGADRDSGVMFGEVDFRFDSPLRLGRTYEVEGEVLAVERKQGRRAGTFDRVEFAHRIADAEDHSSVAVVTHVWIFPREASGAPDDESA